MVPRHYLLYRELALFVLLKNVANGIGRFESLAHDVNAGGNNAQEVGTLQEVRRELAQVVLIGIDALQKTMLNPMIEALTQRRGAKGKYGYGQQVNVHGNIRQTRVIQEKRMDSKQKDAAKDGEDNAAQEVGKKSAAIHRFTRLP